MINILHIYKEECACLTSSNDGTNRLFLEITTGGNENPRVVIGSESIPLSKNITQLIQITESQYPQTGETLSIQYIDDLVKSPIITLAFGTIDENGNMMLKKIDSLSYFVQCTSTDNILGSIESGEWTPKVNGFSSVIKAQGSYMKIGNVVTISFFIQGVCDNSGDELTIGGIPFAADPTATWYAGGGQVQGASFEYANSTFNGWGLYPSSGLIYGMGMYINSSSPYIVQGGRYIRTHGTNTCYASGTITYKAA